MCSAKIKAAHKEPTGGLGISRANSISAKAKLKPLDLDDYDELPADAGSTSYKNQHTEPIPTEETQVGQLPGQISET